ncbi:iron-regulated membrane protein [Burkholderia sp. SJ98]|nr:iron-regulated membrane protein [Burkholderia sp. SJ98]
MSTERSRSGAPATSLMRLRRYWLVGHRWLALSVGWLLALAALTGILLMVGVPVDERLNRNLFEVPQPTSQERVGLEAVRLHIEAEFGAHAITSLRLPRVSTETLAVNIKSGWKGTAYVNPYTGVEVGRRSQNEGFVNFIFNIHSSLAWGATGKAILAWVALSYLLLLLSGVVLWWPRRGLPVFRLEMSRGRAIALYDLHRVGGSVFGLLIAISVATGAFMAYRPLGGWINSIAGVKAASAPKARTTQAGATCSLDELLARAQEQFPDARPSLLQLPSKPGEPARVRLHSPDDPHPNGLTSVWLNPATGEVLMARRWNELDPGARAASVIYPLHTGEIGGLLLKILLTVGALTLVLLWVTGLWHWARRGCQRRR